MNKYMQPQERKRAIDALSEMGTDEAIVALLKRYQYRTEQTITDEEEKELVYQRTVALGPAAIPGLVGYISSEKHIYWPVKALHDIVGEEEAARVILEALEGIEDAFGQNAERRQMLVDNLRGYAQLENVHQKLLELMRDEDEEIVIRAIDGLSARTNDPGVAEAVVPLLIDEATSIRLKTMVTELVIENEWNVRLYKKKIAEVLPEQYFVDATGVVRRK